MKQIRFFVVASALAIFSASQLDAQIISNHADVATCDPGSGLACQAGGVATENSYFQVFNISAIGDYTVGTVIIAMDAVQENFDFSGTVDGEIPAEVFFYWTSPLGAISVDTLGPNGAVPDASCATAITGLPLDGSQVNETVFALECPGVNIPASASSLVVQVFWPGSTGPEPNGDLLFHGGNSTGPAGTLASASCGLTAPTAPGAIGFPAPTNFLIALTEAKVKGCTNPLGDVNLDGVVSLLDVSPFVALLTGGGFQCEADINEDGVVSLLDVNPFVVILTGG